MIFCKSLYYNVDGRGVILCPPAYANIIKEDEKRINAILNRLTGLGVISMVLPFGKDENGIHTYEFSTINKKEYEPDYSYAVAASNAFYDSEYSPKLYKSDGQEIKIKVFGEVIECLVRMCARYTNVVINTNDEKNKSVKKVEHISNLDVDLSFFG